MDPQQPSQPGDSRQEPPAGRVPQHQYPEPEYTPPPQHRFDHIKAGKKSGKGKKIALVILIIMVLAGLGAGAYFLFLKPSDEPATSSTDTTQNEPSTNTSPAAEGNQPATPASALKSTKLNLEITKPAGWTGTEDPASGELTLTSPSTTYAAAGGSKTGNFVLKVRQGADADAQTMIHESNAVQDAETIAYAAPTDNQRFYTNLAVAGQSDNAQFLIITGADQPKKGESMARMLINNDVYVIIGGFRETSKTGLTGFDQMPKATFTGSDEYEQAVDAIKSLKIF
jgi:hypothetical protein